MVSEFIFNLTRFNPHATKLWNLNIFNLKDQFDLTSNLISNRFNIMKFHDVTIKISYTIEIIPKACFPNLGVHGPKNKFEILKSVSFLVNRGRFGSFEASYFEVLRYFNGIVLNLIQLVKVEK